VGFHYVYSLGTPPPLSGSLILRELRRRWLQVFGFIGVKYESIGLSGMSSVSGTPHVNSLREWDVLHFKFLLSKKKALLGRLYINASKLSGWMSH
jgi:hypothetical protein